MRTKWAERATARLSKFKQEWSFSSARPQRPKGSACFLLFQRHWMCPREMLSALAIICTLIYRYICFYFQWKEAQSLGTNNTPLHSCNDNRVQTAALSLQDMLEVIIHFVYNFGMKPLTSATLGKSLYLFWHFIFNDERLPLTKYFPN